MKLSSDLGVASIIGLTLAIVFALHATFGGIKPDLEASDLIPSANAETQNR